MASFDDLYDEARATIAQRVIDMAKVAKSPDTMLKLAEAFAWVANPAQPHGSLTKVETK